MEEPVLVGHGPGLSIHGGGLVGDGPVLFRDQAGFRSREACREAEGRRYQWMEPCRPETGRGGRRWKGGAGRGGGAAGRRGGGINGWSRAGRRRAGGVVDEKGVPVEGGAQQGGGAVVSMAGPEPVANGPVAGER